MFDYCTPPIFRYSHSVVQVLISLQLRMCLCGTRYRVIRTKGRQCKLSANVTPVPVSRTSNQEKQNPSSAVQQQMVLQLVHRRPSLETLKQGWTNFPKINNSHLNILGAITVTPRKFITEDPQIFGGQLQKKSPGRPCAWSLCTPVLRIINVFKTACRWTQLHLFPPCS